MMTGHIPRNMRIVMALLDLAAPYVNVFHAEKDDTNLNIKWKVGGATVVDTSELFYTYVNEKELTSFIEKLGNKFVKSSEPNVYSLNKETLKSTGGVQEIK